MPDIGTVTEPTPEQLAAAAKIANAALDPAGYWEERFARAEAERDRLVREEEESDEVRARMASLLRDTANALKGEPGPLVSHDWSDLPEVATRVKAERGRLARQVEAVKAAWDEYADTDGGEVPWRLQRDMNAALATEGKD